MPEILSSPDYAGVTEGNIEMIKCFKNNIFLSVKGTSKNFSFSR
ncbi:MAG: hypothetical protein IJR93_12815 [Treponema sp.]|nr:hypothetical protein [Treponema sp.]